MEVVLATLVPESVPDTRNLELLANASILERDLANVHLKELMWTRDAILEGELKIRYSTDYKVWIIWSSCYTDINGNALNISNCLLQEPAREEIIDGVPVVWVPLDLQSILNLYREPKDRYRGIPDLYRRSEITFPKSFFPVP